ncbi:MAG: helix-turn-helix transcriptional regulator [Rhizobiales bacterium]|nr:helix-turn-helix transcriptional regulator [Hyphomicrobiales bacterium]
MVGSSDNWNSAVAEAIMAIGTPPFAEKLVAALRGVATFDYSVMFAYSGDARPIDLHDDFPAGKRRVFVTAYQEGPYLLDPFFLACSRDVDDGLYRIKDLAPDRFYQGEYFRSYYVQTGLSEEIGYFIQLPGGVVAVISLMRADHSPQFSAREFRKLSACEPVVRALALRQWQDLHRRYSDDAVEDGQSSIQRHIEYAFHTFGKSVLTIREREVVEFVLKGYSSDAIGKILEIAPGTVRIHRKNIYAKLGINSQGALFSQFIEALSAEANSG